MEAFKRVLEARGMEMDDLVSVQVYSTDLSLSAAG
jgi:enamine deaminase RidA (YjgF/YER057c/UK114 family)